MHDRRERWPIAPPMTRKKFWRGRQSTGGCATTRKHPARRRGRAAAARIRQRRSSIGMHGLGRDRSHRADPLCTIGSHTLTHPRLAPARRTRRMNSRKAGGCWQRGSASRYAISLIRSAIRHQQAARIRPCRRGRLCERGDDAARHALSPAWSASECPASLSVNGEWQSRPALEVLLSGAPFLFWNVAGGSTRRDQVSPRRPFHPFDQRQQR